MKRRPLMAVLFLSSLVWVGCSYMQKGSAPVTPAPGANQHGGAGTDEGCGDVICTENIAEVYLEVVDASGQVVLLDNYYSEDKAGNKLPSYMYEYNDVNKVYTVINDGWLSGNENTSSTIKFIGFKNGVEVVNEVFDIQADCCHISKVNGKEKVVIR